MYNLTSTSTTMPVAPMIKEKLRLVFDNHFLPLSTSCKHETAIDIFFVDEPEIEEYVGVGDKGGFDLLGVYLSRCGNSNHILVCPEKVMKEAGNYHANFGTRMLLPDIYATLLVAVIIHEMGHALMDERSAPTFDYQAPTAAVNTRPVWRKTIEESLCEAFVLTQTFSQAELNVLRLFIEASPAPYSAGLFWSLAASGARAGLIRTMGSWRNYKFHAAKLLDSEQKDLWLYRSQYERDYYRMKRGRELYALWQKDEAPTPYPWSSQTVAAKVAEKLNDKIEQRIPVDLTMSLADFNKPATTGITGRKPVNSEQKKWLDEMGVKDYYAGNDGTVNVNGSVNIAGSDERKIEKLGVQFGLIEGDFDCSNNKITTFAGFPKEVYGSVICCNNLITSLEGISNDISGKWHGKLCLHDNAIVRGGLGIHLLRTVAVDSDLPAFAIIRAFLGWSDEFIGCHTALIERDFEEFATL